MPHEDTDLLPLKCMQMFKSLNHNGPIINTWILFSISNTNYNLFMDLTLIKEYFASCGRIQNGLEKYWHGFSKINSFTLYKAIARKSEPQIDFNSLRSFIIGFNWQLSFVSCNEMASNQNHSIYSLSPKLDANQVLDFGIQLLIKHWGSNNGLTFDQFSLLVKGECEIPSKKEQEVSFPKKKELFEAIINEIQGLIQLEAQRKAVFHQYRNMTDLFQMLTPNNELDFQNVNSLFLSFSERKSEREIAEICRRIKAPLTFDQFIFAFKESAKFNQDKQFKICYSSIKKKKSNEDHAFTTPRKNKQNSNFQSSTKLTKAEARESIFRPACRTSSEFEKPRDNLFEGYVEVIGNLLVLEEEFIDSCRKLIQKGDFDLELVYEKYGKKFQPILNERYGVCNFSAFVRFIVPKDFEHRYLSFIRYQPDDTLTKQTQSLTEDILMKYQEKEKKIADFWKQYDRELVFRAMCLPSESFMRISKLQDFFTERETRILLDRLDPHHKGVIEFQAFC